MNIRTTLEPTCCCDWTIRLQCAPWYSSFLQISIGTNYRCISRYRWLARTTKSWKVRLLIDLIKVNSKHIIVILPSISLGRLLESGDITQWKGRKDRGWRGVGCWWVGVQDSLVVEGWFRIQVELRLTESNPRDQRHGYGIFWNPENEKISISFELFILYLFQESRSRSVSWSSPSLTNTSSESSINRRSCSWYI